MGVGAKLPPIYGGAGQNRLKSFLTKLVIMAFRREMHVFVNSPSGVEFVHESKGRMALLNYYLHNAPSEAYGIAGPNEEEFQRTKYAMIVKIIHIGWGSDVTAENIRRAENILTYVRGRRDEILAGGADCAAILKEAYSRRIEGKKSSISINELSDKDVEALLALLAERNKNKK